MVRIGNIQSEKGKLVKGYFAVGSLSDGSSLTLPVMIASGKEDGDTVWIHGCVHGEEYGGAVAIMHFMNSLDLKSLKGTIIGVPIVNLLGFRNLSRNTPSDGMDLNRVFPGNQANSFTHQLAYSYMEAVCEHADYLIDLHSGGITAEVPFYSIFHDDGGRTGAQSKEMCKHCGAPLIWRVKGEAGLGGSVSAQAVYKGIPAATIECGGGEVHEDDINNYHTAINGILKGLGMVPGAPPVQQRYTIISDGMFLYNRQGGIFIPECKVGDILHKGQAIGKIVNLFGEPTEILMSPVDKACITALILPNYPIAAGELIAEAVSVEEEE